MKRGIAHQKTATYTPQQNGLAERMNRTLLDRVRCMLIGSNLSRGFWAEALNAAVRIINSVPCKGTKDKCPEDMWSGKVPDFGAFKVFGCTAFAHIPDQRRKKLDDKGIECTFIGYSSESKAYRLYCRSTKKVIISRDVTFIENDFVKPNESDKDNGDTFYFDLSEIHESGEVTDGDSNIPAENERLDETLQPDAYETPNNSMDATANETIDDTVADPTYEPDVSVEIENSAQRPATRAFNPFSLLNASYAFCTSTPTTPNEAIESDEKEKWLEAMRSELKSLEDNQTWDLVDENREEQMGFRQKK